MELDIGAKIQQSRKGAGLSQEQAAEKLGVSRQTISNWENEKTYPDIISVIKMSELYAVSLDYLLKGEQPMSNYLNYLDESTNVVKSNDRKGKLMLILSYLGIWAFAMIVFWFFTDGSDALGYSLLFMWLLLPITTFVVSILIGQNNYWGKKKWLAAPILGVMYMLADYGTFNIANMVAFQHFNMPHFELLNWGFAISMLGIFLGWASTKVKS